VLSRYGLRARMAVSYVLVTAAAVLVVEVIMLAVIAPKLLAGPAETAKIQARVSADAKALTLIAVQTAEANPDVSETELRNVVAKVGAPQTGIGTMASDKDLTLEAMLTPDWTVVMCSAPNTYPPGTLLRQKTPKPYSGSGVFGEGKGRIAWAVSPVLALGPGAGKAAGKTSPRVVGLVYAQTALPGVQSQAVDAVGPLLIPGLVVIALIVPVGVLFGLLSTGRLIRRIRRLADVTTTMADGDFTPRIPVSGGDEIGRLEDGFNRMAVRLEEAVRAEREAAGSDARRAERARIARELHDSISQDLFSLSLLAGGLRKALPAGSELRHQAESMERTSGRTMREMQALLLELRPVALEDAGLVPALEELCRAYETRLGVRMHTDFATVSLESAIEHAVLRVVQEALGNAVRHGDPTAVALSLTTTGHQVLVEVRDDGRGFDPALTGGRHGMGLALMRERVTELGGTVDVVSRPAEGTTVRVRLPS
jgi:signal transduction histidine kinase